MELRLSNMVAAKGEYFHLRARFCCFKSVFNSNKRCRSDVSGSSRNGQDGTRLLFICNCCSTPSTQIQTSKGEVIVTNDGATILRSIQALHPAAKMVSRLGLEMISRNLTRSSWWICLLHKTLRLVMERHLL
jgi:hypothetical protein